MKEYNQQKKINNKLILSYGRFTQQNLLLYVTYSY